MAGFATALNGHVYEGEYKSAVALENGVFAYIDSGEVKKLAAAADTVLRVFRKYKMWQLYWVECMVVSVGSDEVYFVENEWDINDTGAYNEAEYILPAGKYVRMRRVTEGDRIAFTLPEAQFEAYKIGATTAPAIGGSITKAPILAKITTDLDDVKELALGAAYTLAPVVTAMPVGDGVLTYQWYKDGVATATTASLAIASYTAGDAGKYQLYVINTLNGMTSIKKSNTITIKTAA